MVIKRTQDSLSSCDPTLYANLYDVRKSSNVKVTSVEKAAALPKDTIEISRDKIKEEALSRLRHVTKYTIVQNSFIRIGKYLFLALAFPPYFLLYGLPKWILVEGLPAIASVCTWIWKKVQQKVQKRWDAVRHKTVQMAQFIKNTAYHVLITPIIRLSLEIRNQIYRLRDQALQWGRRAGEKVKFGLSQPRLKIKAGLQFLQKKLLNVKEKGLRQVEAVSLRLQEQVQRIKQNSQIFLGWSQTAFQQMSQKALTWKFFLKGQFQPSQEWALRATHTIAQQVKRGLEILKQPLVNVYGRHIQPRWNSLKEICKSQWQQTKDFFQHKQHSALTFLQAKQEKLKVLSYLHLTERFLSYFGWTHVSWLKKWLSHFIIQTLGEVIIQLYAIWGRFLLQILRQMLLVISRGTQLFFRVYHRLHAQVKDIFQKSLPFLSRGEKACRQMSFYTLYYSLLTTMIAAILFVWGMHAVRELMARLTRLCMKKNRF